MLTQQDKKIIYKNMQTYEGSVSHMYLDSKGFVTIGIGHLLSTVADAKKLSLYNLQNKKATAAEIKAEFNTIQKKPKNFKATYYKRFTSLTMKSTDIEKITYKHIETFYKELKQIYSDFDSYPKSAKYALFDMIFNLGKPKLKNGFPSLNRAVLTHAWPLAAKETKRRPPVSVARNKFVKDLFNKAANTAAGNNGGVKFASQIF